MRKKCQAFTLKDAQAAWSHLDFEIVEDYGDRAYGHFLHTWDDGKRMLARCRTCGGFILIQKSEFHSFSDDDDSYYTDYFPVEDEKEADYLNKMYDGFAIEKAFPKRYLCMTNGRLHWSKGRR